MKSLKTQLASCAVGAGILLVAPSKARATEPFAGPHTEALVSVLDLPVGVRNIGLGVTGVSDINSPTSYYNPASIAWADAARFTFGYQDIPGDITITDSRLLYGNQWVGDASSNSWRLGGEFGYTTLGIEPQMVRTIYLPEGTGEMIDWTDYYLTAGVGGAWERGGESIAAGVAGKYLQLGNEGHPDAWLLDYGFIAATKISIESSMIRPRAGISVTNNDTGLAYDDREYDIAGATRIGGGVDFASQPARVWGQDVPVIGLTVDVDHVDRGNRNSYWGLGWEISAVRFVQLRAGYQSYGDVNNYHVTTLGAGIGWAFNHWFFQTDYAHYSPDLSFFDSEFDRHLFSGTFGVRF